LQFILILIALLMVPAGSIFPWKKLGGDSDFKKVVLSYGILKQGVLPEGDSKIDPQINEKYQGFVGRMRSNGLAQLSGLTPEEIREIRPSMEAWLVPQVYDIILANPARYFKGVLRSFLYFSGVPSEESQIRFWATYALTNSGTKVTGVHPELTLRLRKQTKPGVFSTSLVALLPIFEWLVLAGTIATAALFFRGMMIGCPLLIAFGSYVFFYIGFHAITCMTVDRYVLPVQPIALASLFILLVECQRLFRSIDGRPS
jgi:hypothetical protein